MRTLYRWITKYGTTGHNVPPAMIKLEVQNTFSEGFMQRNNLNLAKHLDLTINLQEVWVVEEHVK